jgi:hypothetical protein
MVSLCILCHRALGAVESDAAVGREEGGEREEEGDAESGGVGEVGAGSSTRFGEELAAGCGVLPASSAFSASALSSNSVARELERSGCSLSDRAWRI